MDCLNCNTPMNTVHKRGIDFDECPGCDAHWFDSGELQGVLQQDGVLFSEKNLKEGIALPNTCRWCETNHLDGATACSRCRKALGHNCPRDGRAMLHTRFGDLEIDLCPKCSGLWFDGEEFTALLRDTGAMVEEAEEAPVPSGEHIGPCQICGEEKQGGRLHWEHGFFKCVDCLGPEDDEEDERMARLRSRNARVWRDRLGTKRMMTLNVGELLSMDMREVPATIGKPTWLRKLGSWLAD